VQLSCSSDIDVILVEVSMTSPDDSEIPVVYI